MVTIEQILPIDAEAWNEVRDVFNSKHTPCRVEGLKRKFNKLANKPVPTGNPNMPEDIKLAKSIKSKLFRCSRVTNLSEEEEEDEEAEEEEVDDDNITETVDDKIPSQPLITDTEVQEILNNEEEENNSAIAVEVSEEVTDTVENLNTRLLLISCSQGILSSSSFSCYPLLRLFVYMYLSQLMRTFTNYLKCIVISS